MVEGSSSKLTSRYSKVHRAIGCLPFHVTKKRKGQCLILRKRVHARIRCSLSVFTISLFVKHWLLCLRSLLIHGENLACSKLSSLTCITRATPAFLWIQFCTTRANTDNQVLKQLSYMLGAQGYADFDDQRSSLSASHFRRCWLSPLCSTSSVGVV
ncbi:hypothetical protein P153DRAFT_137767 [Dothidotthia symphoricarpi CBS 119687]|uniref:Uncharacterized protein n=1 Tax=Dothidotthia symphoricarpi CBS 119687 TaxID=1392245 RepID=A0A6A5ZXC8_9PLEO|nr:uncharacterized protein P153DRAFT_137767 [Dothidotthia symphoricarpi CBS 119687]KAF2124240.1 hypothetical protein P153DRAFT_137767 [Dothidotthia symphoricarpi CBS 119687]